MADAAILDRTDLVGSLQRLLGSGGVITEPGECAFYAQDVFTLGPAPLCVIRPDSAEQLARALALVTASGIAVVPRGGGMSYTQGYVA
ncbi:MAG TPA: FAD-binding protein, partial [Allosphingosinicella sp.]|nr:FAD-binding protein [Allosphingosinicella sp.]